jgi:hypothetical protein
LVFVRLGAGFVGVEADGLMASIATTGADASSSRARATFAARLLRPQDQREPPGRILEGVQVNRGQPRRDIVRTRCGKFMQSAG